VKKVGLGVSLVLVGISGCSGATTVQRVQQQPHRHWFNERVQLEGTVVDRAPMIDAVVYQLQDETGQIWVLSTEPTVEPIVQTGDRVLVRGIVRFESILLEEQEFGEAYIEEMTREMVEETAQSIRSDES
jgi:RecJ-like exonuclease